MKRRLKMTFETATKHLQWNKSSTLIKSNIKTSINVRTTNSSWDNQGTTMHVITCLIAREITQFETMY